MRLLMNLFVLWARAAVIVGSDGDLILTAHMGLRSGRLYLSTEERFVCLCA
jgi:hypothetical protein